ncbi:MAG: NADH-quinone oxidoreductase subunit J [Deltaproteobacteria bacterium]|nr:NADH-quinone oxidoreductase subunit J [Deltaproteobacteria bacterium]
MNLSNISIPSDLVFLWIAAITVAAAVMVCLLPNIIHSAIALLFTLMGVAGIFLFLSADFLAATQMLVYVGGITMLLLFAVFLSHRLSDVKISNPARFQLPAAAICLSLFGVLSLVAVTTPFAVKETRYVPTTANIGELLMTRYLLPFEIASVLLLAALIGAAMISRPARGNPAVGQEDAK